MVTMIANLPKTTVSPPFNCTIDFEINSTPITNSKTPIITDVTQFNSFAFVYAIESYFCGGKG